MTKLQDLGIMSFCQANPRFFIIILEMGYTSPFSLAGRRYV